MKENTLKYHYTHQGETCGGFLTKAAAVRAATKVAEAHSTSVKVFSPKGKLVHVANETESAPESQEMTVNRSKRSVWMSDTCWDLLHEATTKLNMNTSDTIEKALVALLAPSGKIDDDRSWEYGESLIQKGLNILRMNR